MSVAWTTVPCCAGAGTPSSTTAMPPRLAISGEKETHNDEQIRGYEHKAAPTVRAAVPHDEHGEHDGSGHRHGLLPAEAQGEAVRGEEREEHDCGRYEQRDLCARRKRNLARELHLSRARDHHRAAVLGRVPHDRDDHRCDEELTCTDCLCERVERVHEDLAHDG